MRSSIHKIGFEIEGEFHTDFINELREKVSGCEVKNDGSVNSKHDNLLPKEFITPPLRVTSSEIKKIFGLFEKAYEKKKFNFNSTAGFHIHVSFKPQRPPEILSFSFYKKFMKDLDELYPEVIPSRIKGNYCRAVADNKEVYRGSERYRAINFQDALSKHGTIEFRIFPSNKPSILSEYLNFTLAQIRTFIKTDFNSDAEVNLGTQELFVDNYSETVTANPFNETICAN